ncbi:hypothetical protein [Sphingobium yanoikuyae]|uniref:hypothetical protein n=1 Tax=Sphingobium yanoikuyae TaxID=13690 RepID=UPI0011130E1C|nr:hypothetical protein [Sphingobium yanoikuyae]
MTTRHFLAVSATPIFFIISYGAALCQSPPPLQETATTSEGLRLSRTSGGSVHGATVDHSLACIDTQAIVATFPIKNCLKVEQTYGGSAASGIRQAIEGYSILQKPTAPSNKLRFYVGGSFTAEAIAGDGGFSTSISDDASAGATSIRVTDVSGIGKGDMLTIALIDSVSGTAYQQVVADAIRGSIIQFSPPLTRPATEGATVIISRGELQGAIAQGVNRNKSRHMDAVIGIESNITVEAGAAPRIKIWNSNVNNADDRAAGLQWDAAIGLSSSSPQIHSRTGILFSPYGGYFPVERNGTLIGAYSGAQGTQYSISRGIDFSGVEITGSAFAAQVNTAEGIAPSTPQPGFAIQGNLSGGAAEINLVNTYENAPTALTVLQKTGKSVSIPVLTLSGVGDLSSTGIMQPAQGVKLPSAKVAELPTCQSERSGLMFFAVDAADNPTYRAIAASGGTTRVNVTCDGKNWRYM